MHRLVIKIAIAFSLTLPLFAPGRAHAGFTDNEQFAMRTMFAVVQGGLSKDGSTKLLWKALVNGEKLSQIKLQRASTSIKEIRDAPNVYEYIAKLVSEHTGNCGEHATILQAGLLLMKHRFANQPNEVFSAVQQYILAPGDHVFVVVTSADQREVAILDSWANISMILAKDSFDWYVTLPAFASVTWGRGNDTPDNPYVKANSMLVVATGRDLWPAIKDDQEVQLHFMNAFPGAIQFFFRQ
jgi:hypothetical protein